MSKLHSWSCQNAHSVLPRAAEIALPARLLRWYCFQAAHPRLFAAMLVNLRMTPPAESVQQLRQRMAHHDNAKFAPEPASPPHPPTPREFTSGGHRAGFTTGQQKHVILRRTPYLGAYVRENQVHGPLISIIHHKLCKAAIGRAKA